MFGLRPILWTASMPGRYATGSRAVAERNPASFGDIEGEPMALHTAG
jgi:hypothetical protein